MVFDGRDNLFEMFSIRVRFRADQIGKVPPESTFREDKTGPASAFSSLLITEGLFLVFAKRCYQPNFRARAMSVLNLVVVALYK